MVDPRYQPLKFCQNQVGNRGYGVVVFVNVLVDPRNLALKSDEMRYD